MTTDNSGLRRFHGHGTRSLSVFSSSAQHTTSSPLHSASVQITGFADLVNPNPWKFDLPERREKEKDDPSQDYLSPKKLVELTGESNLHKVNYLEFSINTLENSLGNFGAYVPNLTQLRLVNSHVPCVRDLGTCLARVEVLWLPRCKLRDLDGLPALSSLRELYLAFNEVTDISLITMLSSLELLDLESNNLSELDQIGYLTLCPSLVSVTLDGNPVCTLLAEKESGYRSAIREVVPHLKVLDDSPLMEEEEMEGEGGGGGEKDDHSSLTSRSTLFALSEAGVESDWRIVQQSIKQSTTSLIQLDDEIPAPTGATNTNELSARSLVRPQTAPPSGKISPLLPMVDDSSELTHGLSQVICGNPARALKARRQHGLISQSAVLLSSSPSPPPTPAGQQLLSQLQQWKLNTVQEVPESSCSAALEEAGITVTRTTSMENLEDVGRESWQTDRLSQSYSHSQRTPTPPKATSPLPPPTARPHSVADFRHRRYRRTSAESSRTQYRPHPHQRQQLFSSDTH